MTFKSLFAYHRARERADNRVDTNAGMIVFLMMALVFVPIMAAHAAVQWQDQAGPIGAQKLASIVNMLVSLF